MAYHFAHSAFFNSGIYLSSSDAFMPDIYSHLKGEFNIFNIKTFTLRSR